MQSASPMLGQAAIAGRASFPDEGRCGTAERG
jgi:hypothetical protein